MTTKTPRPGLCRRIEDFGHPDPAITRRQQDLSWQAMDERECAEWWIKLTALQNLAWQYIDSMLDTSKGMKRPESKGAARKLAQIRRDYDRMRSPLIPRRAQEAEADNAERFEEFNEDDFRRLANAIALELGRHSLKGDEYYFQLALYQAMTVYRAVEKYSYYVDMQKRLGPAFPLPRHSLLIGPFLQVAPVLMQLARPRLVSDRTMTLSARILVNRVHSCGIHKPGADGDRLAAAPDSNINPQNKAS